MAKFNVYAHGTYWGTFEAETAEDAMQNAADENGTTDVGQDRASTEGMATQRGENTMFTLESILDNGGETADRYTLTFMDNESGEMFMYGADENPYHPQGFGMFVGEGGFPDTDEFPEIGRAIDWHQLPDQVKRLVSHIEKDS